jgi:hypothetical protein
MSNYPAHSYEACVERLPPRARRKYNNLLATIEDAEALLRVGLEREEVLATRARVLRASSNAQAENAGPRLQRQLDQLDAEHQDIDARRAKLSSAKANAQQVLARLRGFVVQHFGEMFLTAMEAPEVTPALHPGETLADAILRIRGEVGALQTQLARVKNAPLPKREIEAWVDQQIAMWRRDGPRILIADGKLEIIAPDIMRYVAPNQPLAAPSGCTLRYEAALRPAELRACLLASIEDSPYAIASSEKPAQVAALEAQIIELEHIEESLCERALGEGLTLHRRPDMSGFALLGLRPVGQAAPAILPDPELAPAEPQQQLEAAE